MLGLEPLLEGRLVGEASTGRSVGSVTPHPAGDCRRPAGFAGAAARLPASGTAATRRPGRRGHGGRPGTGPVGGLAGAARREHGQRRRRAGPAVGAGRLKLDVRDPDVPLSDTGRAQAEALGTWLAELPEDERPTAALSSPFNRALTTAQLATEKLGIPVRTDERLRERDFGAFDGMTGAGIREQFPDEAERRDLLGKFYYRPPGGESWADVALRIRSLLATEGLRHDCERVLIVAHQAVIMVFRYVLENLTEQELLDVDKQEQVANASLTRYERNGLGNLELAAFNGVEHLVDEAEAVTKEPDAAQHPEATLVTPQVLRAWQLPEPRGARTTEARSW